MSYEALKMARDYIQPKGYGHCLCGRNEWCQYCTPDPTRRKVVAALDQAIEQAEQALIDPSKPYTPPVPLPFPDTYIAHEDHPRGVGVYDLKSLLEMGERCLAYEREACAKLCDDLADKDKLSNFYRVAANAIRARSKT